MSAHHIWRLVKLGLLVIFIIVAIARWISARAAKMREHEGENPFPGLAPSLAERFHHAHKAVIEDNRRAQAAQAFEVAGLGIDDEVARMEDDARARSFLEWDYTWRSLRAIDVRMRLGAAVFTLIAVGSIVAVLMSKQVMALPPMTQAYLAVAAVAIVAMPALWIGGKAGAWYGVNPYEPGLLLYSRGKPKRALKYLLRAVEQHPQSLRAPYTLASTYEDLGRLDEAVNAAEELRTRNSSFPPALELVGRLELQRDNEFIAAEAYDRAAELAQSANAPGYAAIMRDIAADIRGEDDDDDECEDDDETIGGGVSPW